MNLKQLREFLSRKGRHALPTPELNGVLEEADEIVEALRGLYSAADLYRHGITHTFEEAMAQARAVLVRQYAAREVSAGYVCSACGAAGVKLWRQWNTMADHVQLLCAACAAPGVTVDQDGKIPFIVRGMDLGRTDQLDSGLAPAVPVGDTFWGYTSVPQDGVDWWRSLPTYLPQKASDA